MKRRPRRLDGRPAGRLFPRGDVTSPTARFPLDSVGRRDQIWTPGYLLPYLGG